MIFIHNVSLSIYLFTQKRALKIMVLMFNWEKNSAKIKSLLLIMALCYLTWYLPEALGYTFRLFDPTPTGRVLRLYGLLLAPTLLLYSRIYVLGWLSVILMISISLYSFIGLEFGPPSIGILLSIIYTNKKEAYEQIFSVPLREVLLFSISLISIFYYAKSIKKTKSPWWLWSLAILLFAPTFLKGIYLRRFCENIYYTAQNYQKEIKELNESSSVSPSWKINKEHIKRGKIFIVVIGESARADYMSIYGYPQKTSPFLKENSNIIFNNAISPAANTILSVPRILSINNDSFNIKRGYDAVTLAKYSGLDTWWISAQGKTGAFDTEITHIASRSDHSIFLQIGDHASKIIDDMELLPYINKAIEYKSLKDKVIFVHILGSHHDPCERLISYPLMNLPNNWSLQLSCYVTSIQKTDTFIEIINDVLKEKGQPYEIIYFSDHGVYITNKTMLHSQTTPEAYHVPFVVIDSESQKRITISKPFDMRHFIDFFASQIGVKTEQTENNWEKYLNSNMPITPIAWDKRHIIDINSLEPNPAITE